MILFSTLLPGLEYGLQQNDSMVRYKAVFPFLKDCKIFSLVSSHFQVDPQAPSVKFTIHVVIIGFLQWCLILEQLFIDHLIRRDEVRNDQSHHLGLATPCFSLQKPSLVEIFFSKPCFSLMLFFQPTFFLFLLFQVSDLHCESYLCQPLASFFLPLPNTRAILNLVSYTEQGVLKRTLQTCPSSNESCLLSELHQTLYFLTEFYHSRLF